MSKLSFLTNFPKVADSFNWHKCWMTIEAGKNSVSEIYETGPNQIPMSIMLWLRKAFFKLHKQRTNPEYQSGRQHIKD